MFTWRTAPLWLGLLPPLAAWITELWALHFFLQPRSRPEPLDPRAAQDPREGTEWPASFLKIPDCHSQACYLGDSWGDERDGRVGEGSSRAKPSGSWVVLEFGEGNYGEKGGALCFPCPLGTERKETQG